MGFSTTLLPVLQPSLRQQINFLDRTFPAGPLINVLSFSLINIIIINYFLRTTYINIFQPLFLKVKLLNIQLRQFSIKLCLNTYAPFENMILIATETLAVIDSNVCQ